MLGVEVFAIELLERLLSLLVVVFASVEPSRLWHEGPSQNEETSEHPLRVDHSTEIEAFGGLKISNFGDDKDKDSQWQEPGDRWLPSDHQADRKERKRQEARLEG